MTTRLPGSGISSSLRAARVHTTTPELVAPLCIRVPPIDIGLPVTLPARCEPVSTVSVSISHAITRPSVLTSGAGTSRSGPSNQRISWV